MQKERISSGTEPRFLTLSDVAAYLNVKEAQVYALVRSGSLPAIKIGGRGVWRVDRERLEAFVDELHEETAQWVRAHPLLEPSGSRRLRLTGPRPLPDDAEAMTTRQAAEVIGVTRQNVNHLIQTGSLRARKAGKKWLVSAEDAHAYRALGEGRSADSGAS